MVIAFGSNAGRYGRRESKGSRLELIIGTRRIVPDAIQQLDDGVEAILRGSAVLPVLDAAFYGAGSIEVLGGAFDRRPMDLVSIEMSCDVTRVTLVCTGPAPRLI